MKSCKLLIVSGILTVLTAIGGTSFALDPLPDSMYKPYQLQLPESPTIVLPTDVTVWDAKTIKTPSGVINGLKKINIKKINADIKASKDNWAKEVTPASLQAMKNKGFTEEDIKNVRQVVQDMMEYDGDYIKDLNVYELKGESPAGHHVAYMGSILFTEDFSNYILHPYMEKLGHDDDGITSQESIAEIKKYLQTQKDERINYIADLKDHKLMTREDADIATNLIRAYNIEPTAVGRYARTYSPVLDRDVQISYFRGSVIVDGLSVPLAYWVAIYDTAEGMNLLCIMSNDSSFDYWNRTIARILGVPTGGVQ